MAFKVFSPQPIFFFTYAMEVIFFSSVVYHCLNRISVCYQDSTKPVGIISTGFTGGMQHGPRLKTSKFGSESKKLHSCFLEKLSPVIWNIIAQSSNYFENTFLKKRVAVSCCTVDPQPSRKHVQPSIFFLLAWRAGAHSVCKDSGASAAVLTSHPAESRVVRPGWVVWKMMTWSQKALLSLWTLIQLVFSGFNNIWTS